MTKHVVVIINSYI